MHHFLQSELLSRRLAYFCCKRIAHMFNEYSQCFFEKSIKQLKTILNKPAAAAATTSNATNSFNNKEAITTPTKSNPAESTHLTVNYVLKKNMSISTVSSPLISSFF